MIGRVYASVGTKKAACLMTGRLRSVIVQLRASASRDASALLLKAKSAFNLKASSTCRG